MVVFARAAFVLDYVLAGVCLCVDERLCVRVLVCVRVRVCVCSRVLWLCG